MRLISPLRKVKRAAFEQNRVLGTGSQKYLNPRQDLGEHGHDGVMKKRRKYHCIHIRISYCAHPYMPTCNTHMIFSLRLFSRCVRSVSFLV